MVAKRGDTSTRRRTLLLGLGTLLGAGAVGYVLGGGDGLDLSETQNTTTDGVKAASSGGTVTQTRAATPTDTASPTPTVQRTTADRGDWSRKEVRDGIVTGLEDQLGRDWMRSDSLQRIAQNDVVAFARKGATTDRPSLECDHRLTVHYQTAWRREVDKSDGTKYYATIEELTAGVVRGVIRTGNTYSQIDNPSLNFVGAGVLLDDRDRVWVSLRLCDIPP